MAFNILNIKNKNLDNKKDIIVAKHGYVNSNAKLLPFIILILFFFQFFTIGAQVGNNACKAMILDYYHKQKSIMENSKGKSLEIAMNYKSYLRQEKAFYSNITNSDVYMQYTKEKLYYKNEYAEIYQDAVDKIVVLVKEKTILWQKNTGEQNNDLSKFGTMFLDSLLVDAKMIACIKAPASYGSNIKKISFKIPERYKKLTKANEFTYYFNTKTKKIHSLVIVYLPYYKIEKQIITYSKEGFIPTKKLKIDAKSHFVDKRGNILKKYANYKIKDYR